MTNFPVFPAALAAGNNENINDVTSYFTTLRNGLNGGLDADNLSAATATFLGLSQTGTIRRGKTNIAASQSTTSTTYVTLTTPDQIDDVVLPTDGLLIIGYKALWQPPTANSCQAAIFLNTTQLQIGQVNGAPAVQQASLNGEASPNFNHLVTGATGLFTTAGTTADSTDVTTGQLVGVSLAQPAGGFVLVFAAAGTYDVSVRFKVTTSGTVNVQQRKLWVVSWGF